MCKNEFSLEKFMEIFREISPKLEVAGRTLIGQLEQKLTEAKDHTGALQILLASEKLANDLISGKMISVYLEPQKAEAEAGRYNVEFKDEYKGFGEMLSNFRKQAGISQAMLGSLSGISDRTISTIENGNLAGKARERTYRRLLSVFCINPPERIKDVEKMIPYRLGVSH